jgi:hypothetical protein
MLFDDYLIPCLSQSFPTGDNSDLTDLVSGLTEEEKETLGKRLNKVKLREILLK